MVVPVVADVLPAAGPVAATGNGTGDRCDGLSLELDSSHSLRRIGDDTVPLANQPRPASASDWLRVA